MRFENFIKDLHINKITEFDALIIVPSDACDGCVRKCLNTISQKPNVLFILLTTGQKDIFYFKKKFNLTNDALEVSNVFIETQGIAIKKGVYSGYPYILQIDSEMNVLERIELNALSIEKALANLR